MIPLTNEEIEMLRERIADPDWDISQQNDVYELLPKLLEAATVNEEVIKRRIYRREYKNEYYVALPSVISAYAIRDIDDLPTKSSLVVAVYRCVGKFGDWFGYDFDGVETK